MTFLRVVFFSVAVLLAYTVFANILPQVQSNPPDDEDAVVAGELDMAGMIAWGEKLFAGKGTCTLCHNNLGRAPDLLVMDLAATFPARLKDPRYEGEAKGAQGAEAIEDYLRESLIEPSAFVVSGFGKKGTNDTVSPMPRTDAAPISLSEVQMDALIAFLQDKAGLEPTVSLPEDGEAGESDEEDEEDEPAETAEEALTKFGCLTCHDLLGSGADVGPKLGGIGSRMDRAAVRTNILDPNATVSEGFEPDMMPQDFAQQMRISELALVLDYLMSLPEEGAAP